MQLTMEKRESSASSPEVSEEFRGFEVKSRFFFDAIFINNCKYATLTYQISSLPVLHVGE